MADLSLFEKDIMGILKKSDEYKRLIMIGQDPTNYDYIWPEINVFVDCPKNSIYYKKYRIYGVEYNFGLSLKSVGENSLINDVKPSIIHIDLAGLNKLYTLPDKYMIYIESNEFTELLAERKRGLLYKSNIVPNIDLSGVKLDDLKSPYTKIDRYYILKSYIDSNVKILSNKLCIEFYLSNESQKDLISYIETISNMNLLKSVFGNKISRNMLVFNIPAVENEIGWSLKNMNFAMKLLDIYVSEIENKRVEERPFNQVRFVLDGIKPSDKFSPSIYVNLESSASLRILKRMFYKKFNEDYSLDLKYRAGLKLELVAY